MEEALALRSTLLSQGRASSIDQRALNSAGYQLLSFDRPHDAAMLLRYNVAVHPASWNVHDSLAQAYERLGQWELAREGYQRSLKLNSGNHHARERLAALEEQAD